MNTTVPALLRHLPRRRSTIASLQVLFILLSASGRATIAQQGTIREFAVSGSPLGITEGPDGNIWFTDIGVQNSSSGQSTESGQIGRITKNGTSIEFTIPTPNCLPHGITAGPDGNLWFTEIQANKIGRVTVDGDFAEFPLPNPDSQPHDITSGPDGNLWFTEINADTIGRITRDGVITEYALPTAGQQPVSGGTGSGLPATSVSQPYSITVGPDRNLWFTEVNANKIGRITTKGVITEFPLATANSQPNDIVAGPDGNLWFAESAGNNIGAISASGVVIAEIAVPTPNSGPHAITVGPDLKIWFTELSANKIGRLQPYGSHELVEYPVPVTQQSSLGNLFGITSDRTRSPNQGTSLGGNRPQLDDDQNGHIWFVELSEEKIGEIKE